MGIEYEQKFRGTPQIQQALRQAFAGEEREFAMQTTYYDTPSGAFSARRYTLRRRLENGISVCTLKTPGDGFGRGEWDVECESIQQAISALCKLSGMEDLVSLTQEGLVPICGAAFTRIAKTLRLPECTLELALDSGVLTGGSQREPLCEIELELKSGSREAMDAFARQLASQYQLTPEPRSKFQRALALHKEG